MMRARSMFTLGSLFFAAIAGCGDTPESRLPTTDDTASKPTFEGVAKVYEGWTYATCDNDHCAKDFAEKAGVSLKLNPKSTIGSPDTEWIPEWSKLPESADGARYVYEALVLAATNKTWRKRCDAAYDEYAKALDQELTDVKAAIARESTDPNPYDRISALMALRPAKDPLKPTEFTVGSNPARFELETALFDAFEGTNRTFVYTVGGYAPTDAILKVIHKREPAPEERDGFCLAASRGEIDGVPKLPVPAGTDEVKAMVRGAVDPDRADRLDKRKVDLVEMTRLKFEKGKVANPSLPPSVRAISDGTVAAFTRDGQGAEVDIKTTADSTMPSGKTERVDELMRVQFAEWPSGVVLDIGDTMSFYGVDVSMKETMLDDTSTVHHLARESKVTGKHVLRIITKGKTLSYF